MTLRRMKTDVSGSRDLPCSSKQQAPKLCVRKSSDGTYRVTNNSAINTNVLAVKKFKSNIPNAELKKVEPPSVDSSDEDNQPSTSDAAYKRKSATSTVTSNVPEIEISDDEQFTTVVPIKKCKLDPENTLQEDNQKRNGIIFRRNTCFVPRPKLLLKSKQQNEITRRRNSCFMSDDHTNYTMPQSLIKSKKEDVVRKVSTLNSQDVSSKSDITITSPSNGDDLFMIQEDSNPNQRNVPMNNPGSSRRKSLLEPMDTFDEDTQFAKVKEPLDLPPRPRQNIQLIESLARYRTIVRFMLNRLEIQQIDFNNDDYINLYKMYRG